MKRKSNQNEVILGVDTHLDVHVGVVIDQAGKLLGTRSVSANSVGYRDLFSWATSFGIVASAGVEGTGTYGAGQLRGRFGVGPQTAAILLSVAGDNPERLRSEAALASLCGVNPLPASSGKTVRHRLNRGGTRSANNALWTIAMVRMRSDPRTQAYVKRRTIEGLTTKEIQRCLKRYIVKGAISRNIE